MQCKRRLILLFGLVLMLMACSPGPDAASEWIIGTWALTHNPAQDDNDRLIFKSAGKLDIDTEKGRIIKANYLIQNDKVIIVFGSRGNPVETRFDISADKSQLIYHNGAIYIKQSEATDSTQALN